MLNSLVLPFQIANWHVKLPTVVRYLEAQFVESFFNNGELLLSSFRRFHQHKDEERGDAEEGLAHLQLNVNGLPVNALLSSGSDAFVLSTSCIEDGSLMTRLNYDSAIRVVRTIEFARAIASAIPGFKSGCQGFCIYRNSKIVRNSVSAPGLPPIPPKTTDDAERFFHGMNAAVWEGAALEPLFRKSVRYAAQAEYRFLWFSDAARTEEKIIVKVPEAIQYCEKIDRFADTAELEFPLGGATMSISTAPPSSET